MKTIKVWFPEYGDSIPKDFIIFKILSKLYIVKIDKNPDYLIFSDGWISYDYLNFDCIRIKYHVEQRSPDFDLVDYEIGFDSINFGDRYLRFPWYMIANLEEYSYFKNYQKLLTPLRLTSNDVKNRGFCSYLSSNPNQMSGRDEFVKYISNHKLVSSGGKHNNNVGYIVDDKVKFLSNYKFNIAAENSIYDGYTTEKIYEAFIANTIPIYIGNRKIYKEFNPKAFVNLNDFDNYEKALELIIQLDENDSMYLNMLNQPKILKDSIVPNINELEAFLKNIFDQPLIKAKRRPHSQFTRYKANVILTGGRLSLYYSRLPENIKRIIRFYTRKNVK